MENKKIGSNTLQHQILRPHLCNNNNMVNSKAYYKLSDFKADFLFAGDIHVQQYFNKEKTRGYSGSLIAYGRNSLRR